MLDSNVKTQLQAYLERLVHPIVLVGYVDDSQGGQETRELLQEIAELNDKVRVEFSQDTAGHRVPSFDIRRQDAQEVVTFAGLPMGHEFTSLILALLQVSGYAPKLSEEIIEQIRHLPGEFRFETYFSLSCQNCPDVVQALNVMSIINPRIQHVAIDGALFQDEVESRQIMSVPAVYLNGEAFHSGRAGVEEFLAKLDTGAAARAAEALNKTEPYDVLVVGGGPAGATAAIYAARKGLRTGVVAERFGGQILDTLAIENFISVLEHEGPHLAANIEEHVRSYDVDIANMQRAVALDTAKEAGQLHTVKFENGGQLQSKTVIMATGARWRNVGVPGEEEYRAKGVAYCPHCDGPLFKGKDVAVIGGGNSGVEAAIDLAGVVKHVTLIEYGEKLRADEVLQRKLRSLPNVRIITQGQTTEIHGDGQKVNGLSYKDRATGEEHRLDLAGVFVQIGLVPNTEWLKGTVDLEANGEIRTNAKKETNVPGVFGAGDCTTVPYKQIVISIGEGAIASLSAFDYLIRQQA